MYVYRSQNAFKCNQQQVSPCCFCLIGFPYVVPYGYDIFILINIPASTVFYKLGGHDHPEDI